MTMLWIKKKKEVYLGIFHPEKRKSSKSGDDKTAKKREG